METIATRVTALIVSWSAYIRDHATREGERRRVSERLNYEGGGAGNAAPNGEY
jgi:hypothetical protein